jgi:hypothetical protein
MLPAHLGDRDFDRVPDLLRARHRSMQSIRQACDLLGQIPADPPMHRRPMHTGPGRNLDHVHPTQHCPDRVQAQLHN